MLSSRQRMAAELLASGKTGRATAEIVGVSSFTVSNWKRCQEFQQELARRQAELVQELRCKLLQGAESAITALREVCTQGDDLQARVLAAKSLLNHCRLVPESSQGIAGIDLATGTSPDLPPAAQTALQELEAHQDGHSVESGWVDYLRDQDLLDDADAIAALLEDGDFLSKTLSDYRQWAASQQERSQERGGQ